MFSILGLHFLVAGSTQRIPLYGFMHLYVTAHKLKRLGLLLLTRFLVSFASCNGGAFTESGIDLSVASVAIDKLDGETRDFTFSCAISFNRSLSSFNTINIYARICTGTLTNFSNGMQIVCFLLQLCKNIADKQRFLSKIYRPPQHPPNAPLMVLSARRKRFPPVGRSS